MEHSRIQARLDHYHAQRYRAEKAMTEMGDAIMELNEAGHHAVAAHSIDPHDNTTSNLTLEFRYIGEDEAKLAQETAQIVLQPGEYELPPLPPKGPIE